MYRNVFLFVLKKKEESEVGEMFLWLRRALAVPIEDLGLVPCTHMMTHSYLQFQIQGIQCPTLPPVTCGMHTYIQTKYEEDT